MRVVLCLLVAALSSSVLAQGKPLPPVVDNSVYVGGTKHNARPSSNDNLNELLGRMEQLQVELQQLRGLVEEQGFSIIQLKKRQNNIYEDLDQRLHAIASETDLKQMADQNVPVVVPEKSLDAVAPVEDSVRERQQYQEAYDTLKNGHNRQAIAAFINLLDAYPNGEYADNSQYWLGEAYTVIKDIESARQALNKLIANYPNSSKVPDALYKLGVIEVGQNNPVKARDYFNKVTLGYPGTTAAHLAEKQLQQLEN